MITKLLFLSTEKKHYEDKEYYKARFLDADCDVIVNVSCDYHTFSKLNQNYSRFESVEVDVTLRNKQYDVVVSGVSLIE